MIEMVPQQTQAITPDDGQASSHVLEVLHLSLSFGGLIAVDDFSLKLGREEIYGLIGPNGAGKTTVFNLLTNVYNFNIGSIRLDGFNTRGKSTNQLSKMGIARTFQNIRLFKNLTVLDNVRVGLHNNFKYSMGSAILRLPKYWQQEKECTNQALELLDILDMAGISHLRAGSLPYGAQRRLEIVRALATNPSVLLLDEPAAGMNPSETRGLMDSIRKIRDKFHISILLIEHDMNLVMGICEKIAVLNYGRIIAVGTPDEIKSNPDVIEAYLGKVEEVKDERPLEC